MPPKKFNHRPLSGIWRPPGYLFLAEGLDVTGLAAFPEEWDGSEIRARRLTYAAPEPPRQLEDRIIYCEGRIGRLPTGWRVTTTSGEVVVRTEEDASAVWRRERPKLREMWREERNARERFYTVVSKLRVDLYDGNLRAWAHRPKVGDTLEIPAHVWGRDDIEIVFELGNNPRSWRNPNIISFSPEVSQGLSFVEGRVLLLATDVEAYAGQLGGAEDSPGRPTIRAEQECRRWITELASQGYKPENKEALWRKAGGKWVGRLSRRGFDRAWASAAPDTWKLPGRKS